MGRKELRNTLLFVLFWLSLGVANAYWNKSKVLSDPLFTVAILTGKVGGTKGATYVEFEYMVNGIKYLGDQGITFVPKKTRIQPIKGNKYLLVYNKNKHKNTYLINIKVKEKIGSDLSNQYSVDSLERVGLISVLGF